MAKYNFFISYCKSDGLIYARKIALLLKDKGYSVWMDEDDIQTNSDFNSSIYEAISNSDCFLPIITEKYTLSVWVKRELELSLRISKSRAQKILPLYVGGDYYVSNELNEIKGKRINSSSEIFNVVNEIDQIYGTQLKSAVLYEKLVEYKSIKNGDKVALTICELIDLNLKKWKNPLSLNKELLSLCNELYRLYVELESYTGRYDSESRRISNIIIETLNSVEKLLTTPRGLFGENIFHRNIYFACIAIRIIYSDRKIRQECSDVLTNGDVQNTGSTEGYIKKQSSFVQVYTALYGELHRDIGFSKEDIAFIEKTKDFIFENKSYKENTPVSQKPKQELELSENEDILLSVAKFMQEGHKLFDVLQARGVAGDFLNCLLTSYERLKNYCEVVGAKDVAADCVDRIVEIRNAITRTAQDGMHNEKAEKGIKSLLGFTIKGSGDYDVFISFKSEDGDLAERIYNFCQQNLKVPFWSKRTLPQLSASEYEDAIYDAIRKSKNFVVVLSKLEYLNASWVKREMSAFDRAITEGRKKDSNFVFVVTDDVYKEIIDSNKMCLDERYCGYQIIKMSEFE
ncbi:MAG: toll/interleukin-1 receptor domain-containing protein, partial [Clostridia bacterium]|nr:toll/interleukin-1 receptor domain-containing protein [Clostridia bacterium]